VDKWHEGLLWMNGIKDCWDRKLVRRIALNNNEVFGQHEALP
jgi:hypothetical protein